MRGVTRRSFVAIAGASLLAACSSEPDGQRDSARPTVYDRQAPDASSDGAAASQDGDEATLLVVGDILVHPSVRRSGESADGTRSYEHLFAQVADDVKTADLAMLGQETLLGGAELGFSGYPLMNGPQEVGDAEVDAGFDVALHANNHALDYGMAGISAELSYWRASHPQMLVTGIVDSAEAAERPPIVEAGGHRIAILNYTATTNGIPLPADAPWAVRLLEESQVASDFEAARSDGAEAIVVCPHWGTEYMAEPDSDQTAWAQRLADLGVTAIIGGHPHVVQPYTVTVAADGRHVPTFWSVGNFVSGQERKDSMVGGMVRVRLRFAGNEVQVTSATLTPVVTSKAGAAGNLTTYKLADYTEELAAGNGIRAAAGCEDFSRQWCVDFCAERLGAGFDPSTCEFTGEL